MTSCTVSLTASGAADQRSPVAAVLRERSHTRHYHSGTQSHLSTSAGYFRLLLLPYGPLRQGAAGFTFKEANCIDSHNAIHPLRINHRRSRPALTPDRSSAHTRR